MTRSAYSSIKGYSYQFLHTISEILTSNSDGKVFTIEGIEDLDVESEDEKVLIQYKYHEEQAFVNSKVAKPIALMFNHFLDNQDKQIKYKLFIFLADNSLPDLDVEILLSILKLKGSTDNIDDNKKTLVKDLQLVAKFKSKLEWKLTQKYDELENDVITKLTSLNRLTNEESKILYLSNAIKFIIDLAIQKNEVSRQITKRLFIDKLNAYKDVIYTSYLLREKGFTELKSILKKQKVTLNIKPNTTDYIINICDINRNELPFFMIELSKKFCYKGNKDDYRPLLFIIDCDITQYKEFKGKIYSYLVSNSEDIKINDGYEDYSFNIKKFNDTRIHRPHRKTNHKYNMVSFNFRLLHKSIYLQNITQIAHSNPCLFMIDREYTDLINTTEKHFYLNKTLNNQQLIELIGE